MGLIDRIKGYLQKPIDDELKQAEMLSAGTPVFSPFSGNAYANDIYRAAVDAIARNAAKMQGKHIIYSKQDSRRFTGDAKLNRILQTRPNPYMSSYDLLYKLVTHYYLYNNAFAFLQKDEKGDLTGIYPLTPQSVEYLTDPTETLYMRFLLGNGKQVTLPYDDVFVARRFYNSNDLMGDSNDAIMPALNLAHTQNEGMENAIKSSATIRGILKINTTLAPGKLKEEKDEFVKDYMSAANEGGIAAIDAKYDYQPIESKPVTIDDEQINSIKKKIYEYLGINESIVNSTYTEDEWAAFYSSVIEPLALQFSLELTDKVFTPREQTFGNHIVFESNRLQFASNESKKDIIKELMPLGLFTVNQALEILNLPPVEDGDKRLQTLNVVNTDKADQYQTGEGESDEGTPPYGTKSSANG